MKKNARKILSIGAGVIVNLLIIELKKKQNTKTNNKTNWEPRAYSINEGWEPNTLSYLYSNDNHRRRAHQFLPAFIRYIFEQNNEWTLENEEKIETKILNYNSFSLLIVFRIVFFSSFNLNSNKTLFFYDFEWEKNKEEPFSFVFSFTLSI